MHEQTDCEVEDVPLPINLLTYVHRFKISAPVILPCFFGVGGVGVGGAHEIQNICLLFASLKIVL